MPHLQVDTSCCQCCDMSGNCPLLSCCCCYCCDMGENMCKLTSSPVRELSPDKCNFVTKVVPSNKDPSCALK